MVVVGGGGGGWWNITGGERSIGDERAENKEGRPVSQKFSVGGEPTPGDGGSRRSEEKSHFS